MRHCLFLIAVSALTATAIALGIALLAGTLASAPARAPIGLPPAHLPIEPAFIESNSGSRLSGWFMRGQPRGGAVLLLHGIRANRLEMLGRARLLLQHGFSVLIFDFQAHGESPGRNITFGYLESRDARAAFDDLRRRAPGERVGIIGVSLGAAAAILADPPLEADAMVLEAVYGSLQRAVENRLAMRLGTTGRLVAPVLLWQVKPRLGFDPQLLQPAIRIAQVHAPLLLIAGAADVHATLDEMQQIYSRANEPKELWIIAGARHVDLHLYMPAQYERRVIDFLMPRLRLGQAGQRN
jgi:alpha-beta hydrolase superfamily lysophospholipase